ncbi:leucine-rich repeat-containing protein 51 [Gorgonomyces haynaldii]|nr:leucine-rich repeat-containing protein 51 [Gorgonomyces haynaldii]
MQETQVVSQEWVYQHTKPIDLSFKEIASLQDLQQDEQAQNDHQPRKTNSTAINLSNNHIDSIVDLPKTIQLLQPSFEFIAWIDLSFNNLTRLQDTILQFRNLRVLYLHANRLTNLADIDQLGSLPNLRNLTLHGNPLETTKGYRYLVLAKIPQLRHIDFCAITKQDRTVSSTIQRSRKRAPKRE